MFIPAGLSDGVGLSNGTLRKKGKPYTKYKEAQTWQANITETKTRKNTLRVTVIGGLARSFMQTGTLQLVMMQTWGSSMLERGQWNPAS